MKKRLLNTIIFLLLLAVEVFIALYVRDRFIRPYFGDVLVVVLIYLFVRIFFTERPRLLPLYVFIFAAGVEFLQAADVVGRLGLSGSAFFATVLGTSFSVADLLCYAVGCAAVACVEIVKYRKRLAEHQSE